jgi:CxxC motif-containing protein (DUF1111 family)
MAQFIFKSLFIIMVFSSCSKIMPPAPANEEILDGPLDGLTSDETARFLNGDIAFNNEVFTPQTGLGPVFVATSCGACHAGDGKGHPFSSLTRFGQNDTSGNRYFLEGAPQLQHRAIPGFQPEVLPTTAPKTILLPPANTGLGFLDAVSDADLLALSDPSDKDGDGISGVPNWISVPGYCKLRSGSVPNGGKYIGRFGKKGSTYDLLQQTANAYNQDMGVSSTFEPEDTYSKQIVEPEVSNKTIHDVVFYLLTLKAPIQRNKSDAAVVEGQSIFNKIHCNKCHVSQLKTGQSEIAAIANKVFYPYTDLLLHDMGPELNDGYTEGSATPSEWKTPALWGLGLSKNSQGGTYFLMHDGRAKSIEEAILLHGGESDISRQAYKALTQLEKNNLLKFLESL